MKRILFIAILAVLLIAQSVLAEEISVSISNNMQELDIVSMTYYQYQSAMPRRVRDAEILKLAERLYAYTGVELDLEGLKEQEGEQMLFKAAEGEKVKALLDVFSPDTLGFVFSKDLDKYEETITDTRGLPTEHEAPLIAEKHLKALGLLPDDDGSEIFVENVGSICMAIYNPETGQSKEFEKLKVVDFGRKLNGLRVLGIGTSRLAVRLGTDGELVTVMKNWTAVEKELSTRKADVIEQSSIEDHVQNILRSKYQGSNVNSIRIDQAEMVMYDDGKGVIEPALFIIGKMYTGTGEEFNGDWIIPVFRNPKARYAIFERVPILPATHQNR